jgi:hypothetical protein
MRPKFMRCDFPGKEVKKLHTIKKPAQVDTDTMHDRGQKAYQH